MRDTIETVKTCQHNIVAICCVDMLRSFGQGLSGYPWDSKKVHVAGAGREKSVCSWFF